MFQFISGIFMKVFHKEKHNIGLLCNGCAIVELIKQMLKLYMND